MEKNLDIKRYEYIDFIKVIAIIMVIILHSGCLRTNFININSISAIVQYAIRIVSEGVPLFIMVNGFLLLHKEKFNLKKHLKKTTKIFCLLIIWSIIYYVSKVMIIYGKCSLELIWKNIWTTDINNTFTGSLWFLQDLIKLYLIFPILKYIYDNNKELYKYLFIIIIITTIGIDFANMISEFLVKTINFDFLKPIINYVKKFNIFNNSYFLLFFMFGGFLYERKQLFIEKENCIKYVIIGICAWILSFIYAYIMSKIDNKTYTSSFNYTSIYMLFIMTGIFAVANLYKDKGHIYNKIITSIGKNSLGIYFLHAIIITLISRFIPIFDTTITLRCIKVVLVLIISWGITLVFNKIPKIKELFKI